MGAVVVAVESESAWLSSRAFKESTSFESSIILLVPMISFSSCSLSLTSIKFLRTHSLHIEERAEKCNNVNLPVHSIQVLVMVASGNSRTQDSEEKVREGSPDVVRINSVRSGQSGSGQFPGELKSFWREEGRVILTQRKANTQNEITHLNTQYVTHRDTEHRKHTQGKTLENTKSFQRQQNTH